MNKRPFTRAEIKPEYPTRREPAKLVKMGVLVAFGGVMGACEQADNAEQPPGVVFKHVFPSRSDSDADSVKIAKSGNTIIIKDVVGVTAGIALRPVSPNPAEDVQLSPEELTPNDKKERHNADAVAQP